MKRKAKKICQSFCSKLAASPEAQAQEAEG